MQTNRYFTRKDEVNVRYRERFSIKLGKKLSIRTKFGKYSIYYILNLEDVILLK